MWKLLQKSMSQSSKTCRKCNKIKFLTEFYFDSKRKLYRNSCRSCDALIQRRRGQEHPDRRREIHRKYIYKKNYGITLEEYDAMLKDQGGVCACCGSDNPGGYGRFVVDHNHRTGRVRSLLCNRCNVVYGQLEESANLIINLLRYHLKHNQKAQVQLWH